MGPAVTDPDGLWVWLSNAIASDPMVRFTQSVVGGFRFAFGKQFQQA